MLLLIDTFIFVLSIHTYIYTYTIAIKLQLFCVFKETRDILQEAILAHYKMAPLLGNFISFQNSISLFCFYLFVYFGFARQGFSV